MTRILLVIRICAARARQIVQLSVICNVEYLILRNCVGDCRKPEVAVAVPRTLRPPGRGQQSVSESRSRSSEYQLSSRLRRAPAPQSCVSSEIFSCASGNIFCVLKMKELQKKFLNIGVSPYSLPVTVAPAPANLPSQHLNQFQMPNYLLGGGLQLQSTSGTDSHSFRTVFPCIG